MELQTKAKQKKIKKIELVPCCSCMPLPTIQIAVYIHVCPDSCITVYVVKILKEFNER